MEEGESPQTEGPRGPYPLSGHSLFRREDSQSKPWLGASVRMDNMGPAGQLQEALMGNCLKKFSMVRKVSTIKASASLCAFPLIGLWLEAVITCPI